MSTRAEGAAARREQPQPVARDAAREYIGRAGKWCRSRRAARGRSCRAGSVAGSRQTIVSPAAMLGYCSGNRAAGSSMSPLIASKRWA
jgi:hypothetical protein